MNSIAMEHDDLLAMKNAEIAAQAEQIDNMVAIIRKYECENAELRTESGKKDERISRLTAALDEALGLVRARREEAEALEL